MDFLLLLYLLLSYVSKMSIYLQRKKWIRKLGNFHRWHANSDSALSAVAIAVVVCSVHITVLTFSNVIINTRSSTIL